MADRQASGFTIIELILFLALSGLFMLIAFAGIGGRSGRVQFTDSMRSLGNYLQRQYSDTLNGVNARDGAMGCAYTSSGFIAAPAGSDPGQSGCTIMGKAVVFSDTAASADVYVIVGRFLTQTVSSSDPDYLDPTLSDLQLIQQAQPVVLRSVLNDVYEIEWQTVFVAAGSDHTALAFIRSPRSSSIYPITFTPNWNLAAPPLNVSALSANASYCFLGDNGQDAEVIVGGNNRADAIELAFDTGCS